MLLDVIVGLIFSSIVGILTDQMSLSFVLFGVAAALVVDLDFLVWYWKNGWKIDEYSHEHRDYFHIPLIFTGVLTLVWYFLLGYEWALVWFLMTMYHFIHDTYSGGWGIRWLYPLSAGYWTKVKYSPRTYFKNREEQREYARKYGNPNWIEGEKRKWWLYLLGVAVILGCFSLIYWWYGF